MSEFKFALNMLKACSGNSCVSPLNIAHALGLIMLGSKDETRAEVVQVLGHVDHEKAHETLSSALKDITQKDVASVAARLFVQSGFELKAPFEAAALEKYNAPPQKVDYMDAAAACKAINSWVEKETKDMIKKLFDPADLDPNTMVALCSALHFKGTWKFPFNAPFEDTFKLNDKESTKATLMTVKENFAFTYDPDMDCQLVELPYTNGSQMILAVPAKYEGLAAVEAGLTPEKLSELINNFDRSGDEEVQVTMPKFTLEESIDLKAVLEQMGVKKMFDPEVNPLSEMAHTGLHIGAAIHKVKIIVDEVGTEAAAATGMVAMMRLAPMPILITADHPFLFFIRYNNQTLFSGRLVSL